MILSLTINVKDAAECLFPSFSTNVALASELLPLYMIKISFQVRGFINFCPKRGIFQRNMQLPIGVPANHHSFYPTTRDTQVASAFYARDF